MSECKRLRTETDVGPTCSCHTGVCVLEIAAPLGWHVISGERLLDMLRRVAGGENPDLVYAEEWANAEHGKEEAT